MPHGDAWPYSWKSQREYMCGISRLKNTFTLCGRSALILCFFQSHIMSSRGVLIPLSASEYVEKINEYDEIFRAIKEKYELEHRTLQAALMTQGSNVETEKILLELKQNMDFNAFFIGFSHRRGERGTSWVDAGHGMTRTTKSQRHVVTTRFSAFKVLTG